MDAIRIWAFSVCAAAVGVSLMMLLFPTGSMEKTVRLIAALFLLCTLIYPAVTALPGLSFEGFALSETGEWGDTLGETVEEQVMRTFEQNVAMAVRDSLRQERIQVSDVSVIAHTDEEARIYIAEMILTIEGGKEGQAWFNEEEAEIKKIILEQFGVTPTFEYTEVKTP